MNKQIIQENIQKLVHHGDTNYENCEKLILLRKTLKYLEEEPDAPAYEEDGEGMHLTQTQAMCWVGSMGNADGTCGERWPMERTEQVRKQHSIEFDPVMFYTAMNMMYSDYCKAAEKAGVNSPDFYGYMAKAFLDDKDAAPNKLARYYRYIAKKI